jgi:hypothetical protein
MGLKGAGENGQQNCKDLVWLGLRPVERIDFQVSLVCWKAATSQVLTAGDIFEEGDSLLRSMSVRRIPCSMRIS